MTCSSFCASGLLTLGALLISVPAEAQVKSTIVIAPTEWETERADWFGDAEQKAFEAQLEEGLRTTGRYRLVDVKDLKVVEGSGGKKGGVHGAQLLVRCAIAKANRTTKEGAKVNVLGVGKSQKIQSSYQIEMDVTLVSTKTQMELTQGAVAINRSYEDAVRSADIAGVNFRKERTYSDESTNHVIKDLVAEAVKVIDRKVREYGWRSTVKGIVNGKPVILGGKRDGLSPGMEFDLIERTEPLIDDETGEILDEGDEKAVGRLRVVEVKEKVSYCEKISGREAVKGDMVRLDETRKRGATPARQNVLTASQ